MFLCLIGEMTFQKIKFFVKEKESIFCKQLLRAIFYITFEFISDMNTQDQVQISSRDTDANSKEKPSRFC